MGKLLCSAKRQAFCCFVAVLLIFAGCSDDSNPVGGGNYTYTGGTVELGGLTWMTENLNRATSNSWCYGDDPSNCAKYGRLYTWDAAMKACPSGWRLPTREDWNDLVEAAGGNPGAGTKLKSGSPDWNGTDDFGFSALPGGCLSTSGRFLDTGIVSFWWSATEDGSGSAWTRTMASLGGVVTESSRDKGYGFSVRCVFAET